MMYCDEVRRLLIKHTGYECAVSITLPCTALEDCRRCMSWHALNV